MIYVFSGSLWICFHANVDVFFFLTPYLAEMIHFDEYV